MAFLTSAVTALTLAGTPGHVVWTDTTTDGGTPRPYSSAFTRLGLSGTSARLYGAWTRSPAPAIDRSGLGPYTQLGPRGPQERYGSFAGKAEISADAKSPVETLRPVLTVGQLSDVELELFEVLASRWAVTARVGQAKLSSDTLRPVFTIPRAQVASTGAQPKAGSDTIKPVLTVASLLQRNVPSAVTLTPVLTVEGATATSFEKLGADTLLPVLTVTAARLALNDAIATTETLTPVLGLAVAVDRVTGALSWSATDTLRPALTVLAQASAVGEVDKIRFTDRPCGRIRITPK